MFGMKIDIHDKNYKNYLSTIKQVGLKFHPNLPNDTGGPPHLCIKS